jgi:hypothetical protein
MSWIRIETRDGVTAFRPGDEVAGTVRWQLDQPPRTLELRLFWYTQGKGDQDVGVVDSLPLAEPGLEGRSEGPSEGSRSFRFRLPAGPFSFSGKLISLLWAIEAVSETGAGAQAERCEIIVSPTGREILLQPQAPPIPPTPPIGAP